MKEYVYIAACAENGGIYRYERVGERLIGLGVTQLSNVMFLAKEGNKLYAIIGKEGQNSDFGRAVCFEIIEDGQLVNMQELGSTNGSTPCHLCVDNGQLFVVNYNSGSVTSLPDGTTVIHEGSGISMPRQSTAHTHMACLSPRKRKVFVTDLSLDTIFVYDRKLNLISKARVPSGYGARHLALSRDGKYVYCVNELRSSVSTLYYERGTIEYFDTVECPIEHDVINTAAAIRLACNDEKLLISNRGEDTIALFGVNGARLNYIKSFDCYGKSPRDFDLTPDEKLLVCCNQNSNSLTLFSFDGSELSFLSSVPDIPNPLCVIFHHQ